MSLHDIAARALHVLDPEDAHRFTIRALAAGLGPHGGADDPILATTVAGLALPNCVGLAPGFDKNAVALGALSRTAFGWVEVGAATPRAQAGNPRPRLFRLSEDRAAINRMGFNNDGAEAIAARLARRPPGMVLGLLALVAFLWSLRSGQFDDLDGAGHRVLMDDDIEDEE